MTADATYWNGRYLAGHGSGAGSLDEPVKRKVEWLASTCEELRTITEVGCGDFNFGKHLTDRYPRAIYTGLDIAQSVIHNNKQLYGSWRKEFFSRFEVIPPADLLLCVDVLFHISSDAEYHAMLSRLKTAWTKYLALTAYEYDAMGKRSNHVHIRKFDPSFFGTPIFKEVAEEDGELYFYIFKK